MKYFNPNHDDDLIVSMRMINVQVKRIMIDIGSSIDILYFDTFQKLEISTNDLTPMAPLLMGFTSNSISSLGIVNLYVMFGDELCSKMVMTIFLVVDILSTTM